MRQRGVRRSIRADREKHKAGADERRAGCTWPARAERRGHSCPFKMVGGARGPRPLIKPDFKMSTEEELTFTGCGNGCGKVVGFPSHSILLLSLR